MIPIIKKKRTKDSTAKQIKKKIIPGDTQEGNARLAKKIAPAAREGLFHRPPDRIPLFGRKYRGLNSPYLVQVKTVKWITNKAEAAGMESKTWGGGRPSISNKLN